MVIKDKLVMLQQLQAWLKSQELTPRDAALLIQGYLVAHVLQNTDSEQKAKHRINGIYLALLCAVDYHYKKQNELSDAPTSPP